ncbi:hypothetical protein [Shewanella sp. UCD-KL21]|nr:hypothetical protein [Shewanella sp. UCD-KL21]
MAINERRVERQTIALFKRVKMAKQDIKHGQKMSPENALRKMRAARK